MKLLKQFLAMSCVASICVGLSPSLLHAQSLTDSTDRVVAADFPPLIIEGDPDHPGLALEILRIAAKRLNRGTTVEFLPFQRVLYSLEQKSDLLTPALFRSPQREEKYTWIVPILADDLQFMTFGPAINSLEEAKKLPAIVVETGSSSAQVLVQNGFENLVFVATTQASAQMLAAERVQAWFQTRTAGLAALTDLGLDQPLISGEIIHRVEVYLAASPTFPADVAKLYHDAISVMHADGTIETLQEKYRQRKN